MECGYWWRAPYLHPRPSAKVTYIEQFCVEPKGHDGPHRSRTNVTTPQREVPPKNRAL